MIGISDLSAALLDLIRTRCSCSCSLLSERERLALRYILSGTTADDRRYTGSG